MLKVRATEVKRRDALRRRRRPVLCCPSAGVPPSSRGTAGLSAKQEVDRGTSESDCWGFFFASFSGGEEVSDVVTKSVPFVIRKSSYLWGQ